MSTRAPASRQHAQDLSYQEMIKALADLAVRNKYETVQLLGERGALAALRIAQIQPLNDSQKLRASLGSVAASTQRLADAGDASAKLLVDELRRRGITINPNAAPAPPPR